MSVTLLFTDIEGSTRLVQELGDAYPATLEDHRARVRAAIAESGLPVRVLTVIAAADKPGVLVSAVDGEGGECTLNGLYLSDGRRLVDNHTTIDHAQPHCSSREVYKGILADRARELPKDRPLLVYCAGGYRSSIAASVLQHQGFTNVSEIAGGLAAWEAAQLPVARADASPH